MVDLDGLVARGDQHVVVYARAGTVEGKLLGPILTLRRVRQYLYHYPRGLYLRHAATVALITGDGDIREAVFRGREPRRRIGVVHPAGAAAKSRAEQGIRVPGDLGMVEAAPDHRM